jgi:hypothetical protein
MPNNSDIWFRAIRRFLFLLLLVAFIGFDKSSSAQTLSLSQGDQNNPIILLAARVSAGEITREAAIASLRDPTTPRVSAKQILQASTVAVHSAIRDSSVSQNTLDEAEVLGDLACEAAAINGDPFTAAVVYAPYAEIASNQRSYSAGRKAMARLKVAMASPAWTRIPQNVRDIFEKVRERLNVQLAHDPADYESVISRDEKILASEPISAEARGKVHLELCNTYTETSSSNGEPNVDMALENCQKAKLVFTAKNAPKEFARISVIESEIYQKGSKKDPTLAIQALRNALTIYTPESDAVTNGLLNGALAELYLSELSNISDLREIREKAESAISALNTAIDRNCSPLITVERG